MRREGGKKVFTRGSNRIKSCFGEITGRRIKNGPLRPSLSNKTGLMRMTATDIPEHK